PPGRSSDLGLGFGSALGAVIGDPRPAGGRAPLPDVVRALLMGLAVRRRKKRPAAMAGSALQRGAGRMPLEGERAPLPIICDDARAPADAFQVRFPVRARARPAGPPGGPPALGLGFAAHVAAPSWAEQRRTHSN